jgi:pseudouridine-5'-phosphate glycosidase
LNPQLPASFQLSIEVGRALSLNLPVVALESTVITHGLPYPENLTLAGDMEGEVRNFGAVPATVAVLLGRVFIGLNNAQLQELASSQDIVKISTRDLAPAMARFLSGGTTVAGTMLVSHAAGIRVFATGGIGGVHRQAPFDVSADLPQLAKTPMIVVCAGAKAILDLPATLEYLETAGVPVVGYQTNDFPAFYSRSSGLKTSASADSAFQVVQIAKTHWSLGMQSAILVVAPPPEEVALPVESVEQAIRQALRDAREQNVHGQQVTPFLLKRVSELTGGASLRANLGLLRNNARIAAEIARQLSQGERFMRA